MAIRADSSETGPVLLPVGIVGVSFREAGAAVRTRLAALEREDRGPSAALLAGGHAGGVAFLETCARVEWFVSSQNVDWAISLIRGALSLAAGHAVPVHERRGRAAVHYLLRLAVGLDSVAEGEAAVGRQLIRAFAEAHRLERADRALRLCWRAAQRLIADRRKRGIAARAMGVQALVADELSARAVPRERRVLVLGNGEIGLAVVAALRDRGFSAPMVHGRATFARFLTDARDATAVVVCTGAPAAFVDLPSRADGALVVDVGAPSQVLSAPGWTCVPLETLLAERSIPLLDQDRAFLSGRIEAASAYVERELRTPPPRAALISVDRERKAFLNEILPPLLASLPNGSAAALRRACASFAHRVIEHLREERTA